MVSSSQLSVCSWNLLAPSLHEVKPGGLNWEYQRLPALHGWLVRLAHHDILCFQEAECGRMLDTLHAVLVPLGFAGVHTPGRDTLVNAIFFRVEHLTLLWLDPRSRVLLAGFALRDGRVVGIANVHLEAGQGPKQRAEAQQQAQLTSALVRMTVRRPFASIVCGDFNSSIAGGSPLHRLLTGSGLRRARLDAPTIMVSGFAATIDHIWSDCMLQPNRVWRCPGAPSRLSLPDAEHPSDHLPVSASIGVEAFRARMSRVLELQPRLGRGSSLDKDSYDAWTQVLRSRDPLAGHPGSSGKQAAREQRQLEACFLRGLGMEDAEFLRNWHSWASGVATAVVARAVACAAARVFPCSKQTLPEACSQRKSIIAIPPERGKIKQLLGG